MKDRAKYNQLRFYNKNTCIVFNPIEYSTEELLNIIASVLDGGIDIIRLQDTVKAEKLLDLSIKTKQLCALYDAMFLLDNRVDIAQLSEADGIFLNVGELDIISARKILDETTLIGVSVNTKEDALSAIKNGADYIVLDSIFSTPSNPTFDTVGLEYAKWVSENIYITAFAEDNIDRLDISEISQSNITRISALYSKETLLSPVTATEKLINLTNIK